MMSPSCFNDTLNSVANIRYNRIHFENYITEPRIQMVENRQIGKRL